MFAFVRGGDEDGSGSVNMWFAEYGSGQVESVSFDSTFQICVGGAIWLAPTHESKHDRSLLATRVLSCFKSISLLPFLGRKRTEKSLCLLCPGILDKTRATKTMRWLNVFFADGFHPSKGICATERKLSYGTFQSEQTSP